jgi:signal transduction histidine kinase
MINIWKKSFAAVAAAVLIVSTYFIIGIILFSSALYDDINTKNLEEAVYIYGSFTPAEVFTEENVAADWASRLGEHSYRITLINRRGYVIFESVADTLTMENHLDRAEFQAAIRDGIGTARRRSATLGQNFIYSAMAIYDRENTFAGVIRLSFLAPGFSFHLLGSAIPFLSGGFVIILLICAGLYIFSRRLSYSAEQKLDEELKKKTIRLVRLEQVRKDFAANVSHELRTPIQVIKGFAENILNSSLDDKEETRHFAKFIAKNTQTMENLTSDLMTLVSLEDENRPRPPMEENTLAPLIAEAVAMLEPAARKKNISVETNCPPELSAKVYGSLIIQALVNLLDNGIKYSCPFSTIRIRAFKEQEELVIEVRDKGTGIPAEHLGRIFERFYRVDRSRSREEGGTGLGLSIVRHIALLHNGSAEAESRVGEGSVFRLRLNT